MGQELTSGAGLGDILQKEVRLVKEGNASCQEGQGGATEWIARSVSGAWRYET